MPIFGNFAMWIYEVLILSTQTKEQLKKKIDVDGKTCVVVFDYGTTILYCIKTSR